MATRSPRHDLEFLTDVLNYRAINAAVSTAAKGSFLNHLWYLCPELVVLAMFDSEVPNAEKAAMARALLQHSVPDTFAPGKPGGRLFEQITPKLADFIAGRAETPCLLTFITDRNWFFFHLVGKCRRVVAEDT